MWCMTCDTLYMTHNTWHVTHKMGHGTYKVCQIVWGTHFIKVSALYLWWFGSYEFLKIRRNKMSQSVSFPKKCSLSLKFFQNASASSTQELSNFKDNFFLLYRKFLNFLCSFVRPNSANILSQVPKSFLI